MDTVASSPRLYRHYYLHGSYQWTVDEATVITPNFLMIYLPNAPLEFQVGANAHKLMLRYNIIK